MRKLRHLIMWLIYPLLKFSSRFGKPEPKITTQDYRAIRVFAKSGVVLLSIEWWRSSNWLIPKFWSHAAMISHWDRSQQDWIVLESHPDHGVRYISLKEFVLTKDGICALKPKFRVKLDFDYHKFLQKFIGRGYDWKADPSNQEQTCCEPVAAALKAAASGARNVINIGDKILGDVIPKPQDFRDETYFKVLYERISVW